MNKPNTTPATKPQRQYEPDYEIEHIKARRELTPLGWVVAVFAVFAFCWAAYQRFSH